MTTSIYHSIQKGLHLLKKSDLMKDSLIVGMISGIIGALALEFFNVFAGKGLLFGKLASSMVVNPFRSYQRKNIIIGEAMHLTIGASLGSIIVQLIKRTGKDFMMAKSIFVSLLAWIGLHNLGDHLDLFSNKARTTKSHHVAFLQHIFFGITTSAAIGYFANPVIFRQPSNTQDLNRSLDNTPRFMPSEFESESEASNTPVVH